MLQANRSLLRLLATRDDDPEALAEKPLGQFVEVDGAYVLDIFVSSASKEARDFSQDLTAFECFVNSTHLEDFYAGPIDWLRAVRIGLATLKQWKGERSLNCIIIQSNVGFVMKFHLVRDGEDLWGGQMDTSPQPVVVIATPVWDL